MAPSTETIVLGGGCFWCTEAVFSMLEGVVSATSGYAGGTTPNPNYEEVCSGNTGHAEASQVVFDPQVLPLEKLLEVFLHVHDPTSRNRQGADVGTQYRSIILYTIPEQKAVVDRVLVAYQKTLTKPIVTEVKPLQVFFPAEQYHQRYFERHPYQSYCAFTIQPKVEKTQHQFSELLKEQGA